MESGREFGFLGPNGFRWVFFQPLTEFGVSNAANALFMMSSD
jgi:hypothetical protein